MPPAASTEGFEPASPQEERAYDRYLELALGGDPPEPGDFLRGAQQAGAALRRALERVHARARRGGDGELPFERLGEFRLLRRLGAGGMGVVFLAVQESLGREVALKIVRPELSGSAVAAERFRREARALAALRHPHIVAVHGFGEERGVRYLAMELVPGRSLAEWIRGRALADVGLARKVRWCAQVARALHAAHLAGIVHRDVKPSNVRVAADDRALLLDFGLARTEGGDGPTLTEDFAGSPAYAAPEQITGAPIDARSDVYSLGATLYHLLCGRAPHSGATPEQVLQRALASDPLPPRALDRSLPRDLETVVLQALERDPRRRYTRAADLADDLEAVLELRPVRGRRAGALERVRRLARRHRAVSTAAATAALALVAFAVLSLARERAGAERQRGEAARAVSAARAQVAAYRASREELRELQERVQDLRVEQSTRHFRPEEQALLDAEEARIADMGRAWERTFYEVLDLLRHAERLDPRVRGSDGVRAELYLERHRVALQEGDVDAAGFYAELARGSDPRGAVAAELGRALELVLHVEPPDAEAHLFRLVEASAVGAGGEPRFVAVPHGDAPAPVPPNTWALRVVEGAGELRPGDLVVELAGRPIEGSVLLLADAGEARFLDRLVAIGGEPVVDAWSLRAFGAPGPERDFELERGGERIVLRGTGLEQLGLRAATPAAFAADASRPAAPCRVARAGRLDELELPPGCEARTTARPLMPTASSALPGGAVREVRLPVGQYVVLLRREGHEELRIPFRGGGSVEARAQLLPVGTSPRGFVRVSGTASAGLWMQEREVTCGEYLEFLNDPPTLAEVDAAPMLVRVPRQSSGTDPRAYWSRGSDGRYALPDAWAADWPVLGVSWEDAAAYAAWLDARERARGSRFAFSLPQTGELPTAGQGGLGWTFAYGDRFRPDWSRSCYGRTTAHPGPVLEFPLDESIFGVYDLTGGALEWQDGWWDEGRQQRRLLGGGWGQAEPDVLKLFGGRGGSSTSASGETGLRLAARLREAGR